MLRIHVTSDNLSDDKLETWVAHNLRCSRMNCPSATPCDKCALQIGSGYMVIGGGEDTSNKLTKEKLFVYCSLSKCNNKNSKYDCMFMVTGTCQLDYRCPADVLSKENAQNG